MEIFDLGSFLPWPSPKANKYSRGKALLVAGSAAYPGAACLAAAATERVGAGYTEAHCAPEAVAVLRGFRPTFVVRSWEKWLVEGAPQLASDAKHPLACVVGSGMEADDPDQQLLVARVLAGVDGPVLVDGGALGAIASVEGCRLVRERAERGLSTVLTPHAGEAARLAAGAGLTAPVQSGAKGADRKEEAACEEGRAEAATGSRPAAKERKEGKASGASDERNFACALAEAYQATVVLKGPETFVANPGMVPDGAFCMDQGTPALAKAGTGDVLAGMIGGLLAQGIESLPAAALGATLHAEAARLAAADLTAISVTALDVVERIPAAIRNMS